MLHSQKFAIVYQVQKIFCQYDMEQKFTFIALFFGTKQQMRQWNFTCLTILQQVMNMKAIPCYTKKSMIE